MTEPATMKMRVTELAFGGMAEAEEFEAVPVEDVVVGEIGEVPFESVTGEESPSKRLSPLRSISILSPPVCSGDM